ncbi:MAG: hypothetical protein EAY69_11865 [Cytophagales bacterium]|nr:MAG: hypothetical protein EAY69_11865 [Cytophagales bacterium]
MICIKRIFFIVTILCVIFQTNLRGQEGATYLYCDISIDVVIFNNFKVADSLKNWKQILTTRYETWALDNKISNDTIEISMGIYANKILFNNQKLQSHKVETFILFKMGLDNNCSNSVNPFYTQPIKIFDILIHDKDFRNNKDNPYSKNYTYLFPLKKNIKQMTKNNDFELNQIIFKTKITNLINGKICYFEKIKLVCNE